MNFDFIKFKNLFKHQKEEVFVYVKEGISPKKDWFLIVLSGSIIFVVIVIFSSYFYHQINSGNLFSDFDKEDSNRVLTIDQRLLIKISKDIEERKNIREDLNKNSPKDPSI